MAMEMFVLSDRRLTSMAEWQAAITAAGFHLTLSSEATFDALNGFLPAQLGEHATGFECDHWDAEELMEESPEIDFGRPWRHALAFRWGTANPYEGPAAYFAGAAYAEATGGVVFDCEQDEIITPLRAAQIGREIEEIAPRLPELARQVVERIMAEDAAKRRDDKK
jgi:hypothetical protein